MNAVPVALPGLAPRAPAVDLGRYDWVVVNNSAGKDSLAMLTHLHPQAREAGVLDRMVVVHCDLGDVEWPGVPELAREQAGHFGLRFEIERKEYDWARARRIGVAGRVADIADRCAREAGMPDGYELPALLLRVIERGKWPDSANRWCTSDFKRAQVAKVLTRLVAEKWQPRGRPIRVLNCMGLRAQESPARAKLPAFVRSDKASNGKRAVDDWLPIHDWPVERVWDTVRASGTRTHHIYELGMPRLSCSMCVLASRGALIRAAQLRPDMARLYAAVEAAIGHRFRMDLSAAEIVELAQQAGEIAVEDWAA